MNQDKSESIPKVELLYDQDTLANARHEYGPATEIKHAVDTSAAIYEIRTAIRYWSGGDPDGRTSDVVWDRCKGVDDGVLVVKDGELRWSE